VEDIHSLGKVVVATVISDFAGEAPTCKNEFFANNISHVLSIPGFDVMHSLDCIWNWSIEYKHRNIGRVRFSPDEVPAFISSDLFDSVDTTISQFHGKAWVQAIFLFFYTMSCGKSDLWSDHCSTASVTFLRPLEGHLVIHVIDPDQFNINVIWILYLRLSKSESSECCSI